MEPDPDHAGGGIAISAVSPSRVVPTPGTVFHKLVDGMDDPRGEPPSMMARATPTISQSQQADTTFEYAQLVVNGDPILEPNTAQVIWNDGDRNLTPNFVSISALNRILSRRALRPTMANLLNTIGADGWELIEITPSNREINIWTFKREM